MLCRAVLWSQCLDAMVAQRVMRSAQLADGSTWAIVAEEHRGPLRDMALAQPQPQVRVTMVQRGAAGPALGGADRGHTGHQCVGLPPAPRHCCATHDQSRQVPTTDIMVLLRCQPPSAAISPALPSNTRAPLARSLAFCPVDRAFALQLHARLVDAYTSHGLLPLLALLPEDDGYVVQNVAHHLLGAGRRAQLRELLLTPAWLEGKLQAYGPQSVTADFLRCVEGGVQCIPGCMRAWAGRGGGREPQPVVV